MSIHKVIVINVLQKTNDTEGYRSFFCKTLV